jgi:O-antigen/teichoic acid export membrane protein
VINVLLNLVLDAPFGMLGAAWATAAAYVILTLLYLATSQRLWAIPFEIRRSGSLVVLIVVFALAATTLPSGFDPAVIAVKVVYSLAFVAVAFAVGALDRREIHVARVMFGRLCR